MGRTTAACKDRTNVHSKQLWVPFRIFFRVGNDSSFGILTVVVLAPVARYCTAAKVSSGSSGAPKVQSTSLYEHESKPPLVSVNLTEINGEYRRLEFRKLQMTGLRRGRWNQGESKRAGPQFVRDVCGLVKRQGSAFPP